MKKFDLPKWITTHNPQHKQFKTNLNTFVEIFNFEGNEIKSTQQDNGKYFAPDYVNVHLN